MAKRDVVVVGASAGGVEALRGFVGALPPGFPAAVLVVLHLPATGGSALPRILDRAGPLPARHAREGDRVEPGVVLVAPPDHHLIMFDHAVTLSRGPRENGHRPAVDVLFRSAARAFGPRAVSVVLSGALDDGAAGTVAVKLRGGVAICQEPGEALYPAMPISAMQAAEVDYVLPVAGMAEVLMELLDQEVADAGPEPSDLMEREAAVAGFETLRDDAPVGKPAGYSCPDCDGSLYEIQEGGLLRFRCRVGHAWSAASLVAQQAANVERALWVALRTMEEKAALTRRLGARAAGQGRPSSGAAFDRQADELLGAAATLRGLIDAVTGREARTGPGTEAAHERRP